MIQGVVETALYVTDLEAAHVFYERILGLKVLHRDRRFVAYGIRKGQVLLIFQEGSAASGVTAFGSVIPPHNSRGQQHVGFAVPEEELPQWEETLRTNRIQIEGSIEWPAGGRSIYFRDPSGNLLELLTPGVWDVY